MKIITKTFCSKHFVLRSQVVCNISRGRQQWTMEMGQFYNNTKLKTHHNNE